MRHKAFHSVLLREDMLEKVTTAHNAARADQGSPGTDQRGVQRGHDRDERRRKEQFAARGDCSSPEQERMVLTKKFKVKKRRDSKLTPIPRHEGEKPRS